MFASSCWRVKVEFGAALRVQRLDTVTVIAGLAVEREVDVVLQDLRRTETVQ